MATKPRLYTYCIPFDDGAAPNPYWGLCTLAICKPAIRRTAKIGDWVVGTGSKDTPDGNLQGRVVYAMRVTEVKAMEEYDEWTKTHFPKKIPDIKNTDPRRWLGDSIYDYSSHPPKQRDGVHDGGNKKTDLSGENVLLSEHFFYFGSDPVPLPEHLTEIVHQRQGHRVKLNEPFVGDFEEWILNLGRTPNILYAEPARKLVFDIGGSKVRCDCAIKDDFEPSC